MLRLKQHEHPVKSTGQSPTRDRLVVWKQNIYVCEILSFVICLGVIFFYKEEDDVVTNLGIKQDGDNECFYKFKEIKR